MYELMILSILMRGKAHGYLIASIINDIIGPYARLSNGRLYPLLSKLEELGMIVAIKRTGQNVRGDRHLRSYEITDAGRERFHELMMNTTSNPGEYRQIFLQKVSVLRFLKPTERLYLIDHYSNYCQAHILHLTAEREDLVANKGYELNPAHLSSTLNVIQHLIDQWQLELDWARGLHERELASIESDTPVVLNVEQSGKALLQREDTYRPEGD
ncbi:MAG TPA: PadR family transcriptional regulator [Ktedonobacteraceae bacterium]